MKIPIILTIFVISIMVAYSLGAKSVKPLMGSAGFNCEGICVRQGAIWGKEKQLMTISEMTEFASKKDEALNYIRNKK